MVDNDVWGAAAQVRMADRWHSAAASWNSALTQALLDSANLPQNCLVVDVAAGSGDPALSIIKRLKEGRVIAIDSSRPGLLLAKRQGDDLGLRSKLRLVQADAHKLPISNSCVDRVTCRFGIMFFTYIDMALAEMFRVLKPGGRAAFWHGGSSSSLSLKVRLGLCCAWFREAGFQNRLAQCSDLRPAALSGTPFGAQGFAMSKSDT